MTIPTTKIAYGGQTIFLEGPIIPFQGLSTLEIMTEIHESITKNRHIDDENFTFKMIRLSGDSAKKSVLNF